MRRLVLPALPLAILACSACTAQSPASPCQLANDHVDTCLEGWCVDHPEDVLCSAPASPAAAGTCSGSEADNASAYLDLSCDQVVVTLHAAGGPADGECWAWLQWLCDALGGGGEEEQANCCVNCDGEALCESCFTAYDGDDDGRILTLYCVDRCGGCTDADCDGVCDPPPMP